MSGELTFVNISVFLKLFSLLWILSLVTIGTGVGPASSSFAAAVDRWGGGRLERVEREKKGSAAFKKGSAAF